MKNRNFLFSQAFTFGERNLPFCNFSFITLQNVICDQNLICDICILFLQTPKNMFDSLLKLEKLKVLMWKVSLYTVLVLPGKMFGADLHGFSSDSC
jgi:hypothetical protein